MGQIPWAAKTSNPPRVAATSTVSRYITDEEWHFGKVPSGLQADAVVHGAPKPLLAPQVPLRRFHRNVPQQKLNLLPFAAGRVAQSKTKEPASNSLACHFV